MKEKLQEYVFIAEIVSPATILLSLFFVGFQVRHGTEERAANTQAIHNQVREPMMNAEVNLLTNVIDYPYLIDLAFEPQGND